MLSQEIERRLRLPAPDEPAILPALVLPTQTFRPGTGFGRVQAGPLWRSSALLSPRIALALLALLLALIGAITTGALRLDRLPNPFAATTTFGGRGLSLEFPKSWAVVASTSELADQGAATALIVSSTGVSGCSAADLTPGATPVVSGDLTYLPEGVAGQPVQDRTFACVIGKPMAPGEIRLVVSLGYPQTVGVGPMEAFDPTAWFGEDAVFGDPTYIPTPADGWTQVIDGMPAKLLVESTSIIPGAEEVRTWGIYQPGGTGFVWFVRATLRGPDLEPLRRQADAIALSLRFDARPKPLDEAKRSEALARAIDAADREFREFRGSTILACFPRTPGEQLVEIRQGPQGLLREPVTVTCRTTIETTLLSLWRATLAVEWPAGHGVPAGTWGWELLFDGETQGGQSGELFNNDAVAFPGAGGGELPPPLSGPLVLPAGSLVELLAPGIGQGWGPIKALNDQGGTNPFHDRIVLDVPAGRRFEVLGDPVSYVGSEWYLVRAQAGTSYPGEYAWLPATDGNRPLLKLVEPNCPAGEVAVSDLVYMHPAERVLCFGARELRLDPSTVALAEPFGGDPIQATPQWLASYTSWRLYGAAGPKGVDGPLPFAISPSLGDHLPTGTWLTVHGHFNDPAAATCQRIAPPSSGEIVETPEMQHTSCQELFVVSSFETRAAP